MWSLPGAGINLTSHCPTHKTMPWTESKLPKHLSWQHLNTKEPSWKTFLPTLNHSDFSLELTSYLVLKELLNMGKETLKRKAKTLYYMDPMLIIELPLWVSDKEFSCQCRRHGFNLWSEKIPRATEQVSPRATTTEPLSLEPVLHNKKSQHNEKTINLKE
mgnify:CR=1 FL=1